MRMKVVKFFGAMAIILGFTMGAMAQSTDTGTIQGRALVIQGIDVTNVTDLDFGWVSPGLAKTLNLANVATGGQVGEGTQTTGVLSVSAAAGSNVNIQFTTLPTALTGPAAATLPIGTWTAGWHTANPFAGGTTFAAGTATQVAAGNFPTNDIGGSVNGIYVFIGATVTPGATQAAGSYAANIVLTATYN